MGGIQPAALVGVVRWLVDHGEDLTGRQIKNYRRAALGAVVQHSALQFPVGEILDAQIYAESQIPPRAGRFQPLDLLDDLSVAICST